jgi:hypothetical protein
MNSNSEQCEPTGDLTGSDLDELLAVGEADLARGDIYDGDEVFDELDKLSEKRRREQRDESRPT